MSITERALTIVRDHHATRSKRSLGLTVQRWTGVERDDQSCAHQLTADCPVGRLPSALSPGHGAAAPGSTPPAINSIGPKFSGRSRIGYYLRNVPRSMHIRFGMANALAGLLPDYVSGGVRTRLYRLAGLRIGPATFVMGNIRISGTGVSPSDGLAIGARCLISTDVTLNLDAKLTVGDDVTLSPHVLVYTGTHRRGPSSRRCSSEPFGLPVTIGNGCWVRVGAIILPGTTLGAGCVVGAGAVVAGQIPPNSFVEGNP
ncbi:MAG TPA: hypothetical protein VKQ27_15730, partial [Acetobacteraceae bacterium]|nr:hypothetical protein [Acetobacteraceae bacterium]